MIMEDTIVETDESFNVTVSGPDISLIGEPARVIISDDDGTYNHTEHGCRAE
jgi:hypothetical protein